MHSHEEKGTDLPVWQKLAHKETFNYTLFNVVLALYLYNNFNIKLITFLIIKYLQNITKTDGKIEIVSG